MEKIDRSYIRHIRYAVQAYVLLFLIYAGYRFSVFAAYYESGSPALPQAITGIRPASVEGFLPIGALMSLKVWITEGVFDRIHPAGLVIFIAALVMAVLLKKSFCGWICPVGALSDFAWRIRELLFKKRFNLSRWIDYPLMAVKYVLMALFVYLIIFKMNSSSLMAFIEGDYYKIADVKMLYFFTKMTKTTAISLSVLFVLSVLYRNFWCRYLCPYGALLGLLSTCSPVKIQRNNAACIQCRRCSFHCPSQVSVADLARVSSPECNGCLTCVSHCPSKGALDASGPTGKVIPASVVVLLIVITFFGILGAGRISGKWQSAVTEEEYRRIIPQAVFLDHP